MFLIVQFGSRKTPFIKECVERCGEQAIITDWKSGEPLPQNLKGIIFSGSPTYLTEVDHEPYRQATARFFASGVPLLGICFGHQLTGVLHGAKIFRGKSLEGPEQITLLQQDILFEGLHREFVMNEDHTEGIDLPPGFIHLASSANYPVEAMKHKDKMIWGVQFHPEVSPENGMTIFKNFVRICNQRLSSN